MQVLLIRTSVPILLAIACATGLIAQTSPVQAQERSSSLGDSTFRDSAARDSAARDCTRDRSATATSVRSCCSGATAAGYRGHEAGPSPQLTSNHFPSPNAGRPLPDSRNTSTASSSNPSSSQSAYGNNVLPIATDDPVPRNCPSRLRRLRSTTTSQTPVNAQGSAGESPRQASAKVSQQPTYFQPRASFPRHPDPFWRDN